MERRKTVAWGVALAVVAVAALATTLALYRTGRHSGRRVMYFPAIAGGQVLTESRFEPDAQSVQEAVGLFVDDLLLGPMASRMLPLFARGTSAEFCIVSGGTAYVGLSEKALFVSAECADIKNGVVLLKRNILSNFTTIDTVEVYIDGTKV